MELRAGSQRHPVTSSREDTHFTRMTVMDRAATSRAPCQESGSLARQASVFNGVINDENLMHEWRYIIFSDECRFCLHQDARTRVRWHRGESTLAACIRHRHTGLSPSMMEKDDIGYTSRSSLVHIGGTLNSACYISGVLRPVDVPFIRPVGNVWPKATERLARHHTPVSTVDELWYRVEAAWSSVPVHVIQSLFDSMHMRISAVITARGGCFWY
ncbi:uncharacterized protein TNCV_3028801 [Trichonephila clavipes]|nr:uncharacterized protein TNCV_3028801 [Trichonephila clavipes]